MHDYRLLFAAALIIGGAHVAIATDSDALNLGHQFNLQKQWRDTSARSFDSSWEAKTRKSWAEAHRDLISLYRLQSRDKDALATFAHCRGECRKEMAGDEAWGEIKKWACALDSGLAGCK